MCEGPECPGRPLVLQARDDLEACASADAAVAALRARVSRSARVEMSAAESEPGLPLPLALLADTNLGSAKAFERCYQATVDGWSALDFHRQCDGVGSTVVIGRLEKSGALVGGYNPTGWESRDDYRATPRAFLFCCSPPPASATVEDPENTQPLLEWAQLSVLGPGDVAIFDCEWPPDSNRARALSPDSDRSVLRTTPSHDASQTRAAGHNSVRPISSLARR